MADDMQAPAGNRNVNWKRLLFLLVGLVLFTVVYYTPSWPDAVDPMGKQFPLSREGKGAIAVFLLAGTWWVFEVVPIGVTSLMIGILQALFYIRPASKAFNDFMDPSVMFIFGSIVIGLVFTKTGLTRRLAYKMLVIIGEKTSMIYLGCFVVTAALTHIMAHTAVAATIYPLLISIYALYGEGDKQTRFGKGLFIGMAYVAGAGSIVTLLGAARGAVAIGFFKDIMNKDIGFFELTYYMFPIGWLMTFVLWGFFMVVLRPEKKIIPGIKDRANNLYRELGPITSREWIASGIVLVVILTLGSNAVMKNMIADFTPLHKTAVILLSTVLFYITDILDIEDLEAIPWNIILLFGGAMSIGLCLWETGAAEWLAVNWLVMFKESNWFVFVLSIAFFVMIMTNFIMNVAAIAISLPVALVIAPYLGVAGEVILFSSLTVAGMPFLLLVGAAPNAIAYDSGQFSPGEFFLYGIPASIILMLVTGFTVYVIWPIMGMPITVGG
ncbi:MAG: SLC13/DASS family transporter [Deltaproteobacteria bacterium]|nr:MAG: SLC13/DASS family transporter [Deltaproteobacteria bacterium]